MNRPNYKAVYDHFHGMNMNRSALIADVVIMAKLLATPPEPEKPEDVNKEIKNMINKQADLCKTNYTLYLFDQARKEWLNQYESCRGFKNEIDFIRHVLETRA